MDGHTSDNERKKLWDELSIGTESSRLVVVHLTKGNEGFGFNIRGGVDHPHVGSDPGIFITTVKADSVAGRDGRLEPGDRILAEGLFRGNETNNPDERDSFNPLSPDMKMHILLTVLHGFLMELLNDIRLDCVTHDVAVNEFRKADESVSLLVEKNAEAHILSQQGPKSPDRSCVDGPAMLDPCEEEPSQPAISLLRKFYESKIGALSIGLAVGSLAVFVVLRIFKASKS